MASPQLYGISPVTLSPSEVPEIVAYLESPIAVADHLVTLLSKFLLTIERVGLPRLSLRTYQRIARVDEGSTFLVDKYDTRSVRYGMVAVKTTKFAVSKLARTDASLERRLNSILREIRIVTLPQLGTQDNIIKALGWDWFEDWQNDEMNSSVSPALVMEFAEFGNLRQFLTQNSVSSSQKLSFCSQVGSGLYALHRLGIIQGDVKQENVLVFKSSEALFLAKLSDFGNSLFELSNEGVYRCTTKYQVPEVAHRPELVPRPMLKLCDIYSYGLLVWEVLLNGRHYYEPEELTSNRESPERSSQRDREALRWWSQNTIDPSEYQDSESDSFNARSDSGQSTEIIGNTVLQDALRTLTRQFKLTSDKTHRDQYISPLLQTLQQDPHEDPESIRIEIDRCWDRGIRVLEVIRHSLVLILARVAYQASPLQQSRM